MIEYPDKMVPGELYGIDARVAGGDGYKFDVYSLPAWLELVAQRPGESTPRTDDSWAQGIPPAGTTRETVTVEDSTWGTTTDVVLEAAPAAVTIPAPAAQRTDDGYMLPATEGVRWIVDGAEQPAGSYSVQPVTETTVVTITAEALEGYTFDTEPVPLVLTFDPAAPDPDPLTPEEEWALIMEEDPQALYVAVRLADRIIRHAGGTLDGTAGEQLVMARDHAMTVLEYVKGYTRGRGFTGYIPHRALQAVIVAAAARLYVNPEQLTFFQHGDYSERPATLAGWTMAERAVLRRFRRVTA